ncbi:hypothetical protein LUZ63_009128 [Rhynchospora breviuscula]|uniref:Potassium transporter n=1 Tax=Rhynchospora breviuscula TaxID=2022672 RepID=A0A9Q0HNV0_9POAL|nr:hypothetical protein LUZ63_009128 [Rhynchospora breviuscula]
MDLESGADTPDGQQWKGYYKNLLLLAYQSIGVVYGDLATSPLYVYKSTFSGQLRHYQSEEVALGAFSLVFWTFNLIPLLKYVLIVLAADDNGEGGTFALYSLLCRHAKLSLLPHQQAADDEISMYYSMGRTRSSISSPLKRFLEKHKKLQTSLLLIVLFGVCMVLGDGILTTSLSVMSSVSGLQVPLDGLRNREVVIISCGILVGLFALQHRGTHRLAFLFAPIVLIWLLCIAVIGVYNTIYWNRRIYWALSPHYIIRFFKQTGKDGWIALGGVLLSITGTEAMFADLGHFTAASIRLAFISLIYPCLVLQYMGQAAFLSKNRSDDPPTFYDSIPEPVFWPVFVISTLAAIVGGQSVISATFSIVNQCLALGCFPRVKVVHTSRWIYGQIYIPEINWILMVLCLAVTISFHDTTLIGNAYCIACMIVMFITVGLMTLVMIFIWKINLVYALGFLFFFGSIEAAYLSSTLVKVPQGAWVPLIPSFIFMLIMYVWHYGTRRKYLYDLQNKVSMKWILSLGPSLGIVRIPGIGLIYTELVTGVPAIFSHFVTNVPAFHKVLVFVCVKSLPAPHVPEDERYLIGRIGPRNYHMYRCIVRYGYKDFIKDEENFEDQLVLSIAKFIEMEAQDMGSASSGSYTLSNEGRMAVIRTDDLSVNTILREEEDYTLGDEDSIRSIRSSRSEIVQRRQLVHEHESPGISHQHRVRFELSPANFIDPQVRDELNVLIAARNVGVTYIMGHSCVKARKHSSFVKKFIIDIAYAFLRKNCRGPAVALHIPHISLVEVGMIYYV